MDYYERAGLTPYLEKLGFHLVGYGCTTCIGNSGPLPEEISAAVNEHDLSVVSVLSGNRNFEGRINPDVKMNYLASPPLVVAYALAGTMDIDLANEPLGAGADGQPVYLRDIWPQRQEIDEVIAAAIGARRFSAATTPTSSPATSAGSRCRRRPATPSPGTSDSTYVRKPPYFEGMARDAAAGRRHRRRPGAGQARRLGDHRPHLAGRLDQGRLPRRPLPRRARRRRATSSTRTARAAATTR